ncbi:MAG: hypothetical protein R3F39_07175 [Myxococcota bacterium]
MSSGGDGGLSPARRRAVDAVAALSEAMAARDESAARALSTEHGFAADGDSIGRFYAQGARKGFRLEPLVAVDGQAGRVAVTALMGLREPAKALGQVWLLGHDDGERFRLEAVARNSVLVALFSEGQLDAIFDGRALPAAPADVLRWGESLASALTEGTDSILGHFAPDSPAGPAAAESIKEILSEGVGAVRVAGSGQVAALDRTLVGLAITPAGQDYERELWLVLEGAVVAGRGRVVGSGGSPSADTVLGKA